MPPSTSFIGFLPTQILKDKLIWVTGMYSFDDRILFLLCTPIVSSQLVAGTHISIGGQTKKSIYLLCTPSTKELLHPGLQSKKLPYTDILSLPTVGEFLFDVCASHFSKIVEDPNHPFFLMEMFLILLEHPHAEPQGFIRESVIRRRTGIDFFSFL